ncbi:MAG: pyridoxal phosphate-dependent aminotransferase family protein [Leptolyngbya sp. PLA1]|nr:pyridoxal phosphate-dependent aminotransferase family protein [Leptolyngbya sp. PLA1]
MARLNVQASTATTIRIDGREVLAFGGCNYLGLAHHPAVTGAMADAAGVLGLSTTASRETTGNTVVHDALEEELAGFIGEEGAILLADGYTANIAVCQALARDHGVALIDARAHKSLRSAASAAGIQVFEYEHLNAESAAWLAGQFADQGVLMLTDGVFAADGALAPVPELLSVLPQRRATLVVDDCHGVCVLGDRGQGTVGHFGVRDARVVVTTTLAKGVGCYGGAVLGVRSLVQRVRDTADVYRRSTPIPTPIAAAARAAVRTVQGDAGLLASLRRNIVLMREGLARLGIATHEEPIPIFTFTFETHQRMEEVHRRLLAEGLYAPYIEYPGGPTPRFFRVTVTAAHTREEIERLLSGFARHMAAVAAST